VIQIEDIGGQLLELWSGSGERLVAVIQAFLDESGTNLETPVLSVAGFYGTQDQWKLFKQHWNPKADGKEFHAKDSSKKFPALCEAIEISEIDGILVTIGKETYKKFAGEHFKSSMGNCYAVCSFVCALAICDRIGSQRLSIVLEQGQPNIDFVKRMLEFMMYKDFACIAAVATARKSDFIELHAGDFASHLGSTNDKPWMQRLFDSKRLAMTYINQEHIVRTSATVKSLIRLARAARRREKRNDENI
jgi:hypothetical protein